MTVKTIRGDQGITEDMIVRAAHRICMSVAGHELADLKEHYSAYTNLNLALLYCAAKTYLKIQALDFTSKRQTKVTVREMAAVRLPTSCR
jgi:hypothetical protein